eukprot:TRINITY_DN1493_c0_g1_i2.p1 TRINITY_DN1493_c0_g1~~TRINITY_DN1493_c0_g1_i2.p1  ORF type:complete len:196 (+),score=35.81 TRINITY_DN1493_c0_g1_i2:136-723(+)
MSVKGLSHGTDVEGRGLRVGIVHTEWNTVIVGALLKGAKDELVRLGVLAGDIEIFTVPGSFELPYACKRMIESKEVDVVIAIGCLIKGSTLHFEYISQGVTQGLMSLNLESSVPVIYGVLECLNEEQALERAGLQGGHGNHGKDWALTAVSMGNLRRRTERSSPLPIPLVASIGVGAVFFGMIFWLSWNLLVSLK